MTRTKKLFVSMAACLSLIFSQASAQVLSIGPTAIPPLRGSGVIALGNAQSINGSLATVAFDTLGYDSFGICDTTSTKGVCTVTAATAGKYHISCSARIDATTGPAVGGIIGQIRVWKNGAAITGGLAASYAQVASIASVQTYVNNATVASFVAGDTFSCAASSGATGPTVAASFGGSFLSYEYIGP